MKNFEQCKSKIARGYGYQDWRHLLSQRETYIPLHKAAELYGRYCRFVGYCQGKKKLKQWHN